MKRWFALAFALTTGLAAVSQAQTPHQGFSRDISAAVGLLASSQQPDKATAAPPLKEGQPVVLVGEVTSAPKKIAGLHQEQKMRVAVGPARVDYTLHLGHAMMLGTSGQKMAASDMGRRMWVRAEGTVMNDPRRIQVTKLQLIGKDLPGLQRTAFYRPGFDQGYVMAVAGSRQFYPETPGVVFTPPALAIVGKVSEDTGPLETTRKIQVAAAGNTWTVDVPKDTPIFDSSGKKISVHEIAKGQWLRAHGWQTGDLRVRSARIEEIGAQEAFLTAPFYRAAEPLGYVEREPGTGVRFNPIRVTGVITAIDEPEGTVTLRDDQGKERTVYVDTVTFSVNGGPVEMKAVQKGQQVTVEGSEIVF
jgi:hypothetical protein